MTRYRFILSAVSALFFALSAFAQIDEGDRQCADGAEPGPAEELSIEGIVLDVAAIAFGESYNTGDKVLNISLHHKSAKAFGEFTSARIGETVELKVGDEVVLSPVVREPIWGGAIQLSGPDIETYKAQLAPQCAD